jgi:hypothetical protein
VCEIDQDTLTIENGTSAVSVCVVEKAATTSEENVYCVLPAGTLFVSRSCDVHEAYEVYIEDKKSKHVDAVKKHKIQSDLERISMTRVMRVCLYTHIKNMYTTTKTTRGARKVDKMSREEVGDAVRNTKLSDVVMEYFKLGMAAKIPVYNPAVILQLCMTEVQVALICAMVCDGVKSEEDCVYLDIVCA